jgi:hypothetical protein
VSMRRRRRAEAAGLVLLAVAGPLVMVACGMDEPSRNDEAGARSEQPGRGSPPPAEADPGLADDPPEPRIRAELRAGRALIHYSFERLPQGREQRPVAVLLTVDPAGVALPETMRYPVRAATGVERQRLPRDTRPPYIIRASALSITGARSRVVSAPLR